MTSITICISIIGIIALIADICIILHQIHITSVVLIVSIISSVYLWLIIMIYIACIVLRAHSIIAVILPV